MHGVRSGSSFKISKQKSHHISAVLPLAPVWGLWGLGLLWRIEEKKRSVAVLVRDPHQHRPNPSLSSLSNTQLSGRLGHGAKFQLGWHSSKVGQPTPFRGAHDTSGR